eukprot:scaffold11.g3980.t1
MYRTAAESSALASALERYLSNEELAQRLQDYARRCSAIARLSTIGKSVEGRRAGAHLPIWALELSDKPGTAEAEPHIKYIGNVHGDEPTGRVFTLALAEWLCANYKTDPEAGRIVARLHLWLVPSMNPDAFVARKRENKQVAWAWIDLNRDFPDRFSPTGMARTGREQPETQAIMDWTLKVGFTASASMHEGALVANYPWDGTTNHTTLYMASPDDAAFRHLATVYARAHRRMARPDNREFPNGGITNGAAWYPIYGSMQAWENRGLEGREGEGGGCRGARRGGRNSAAVDGIWHGAWAAGPCRGQARGDWNYIVAECMEITLELSLSKWPPEAQLPELWQDNRKALLEFAWAATYGGLWGRVKEAAGKLRPGKGQEMRPLGGANISVAGIDKMVHSRAKWGDYYRPLAPGEYKVTVSKAGYRSATALVTVPADGSGVRRDFVLAPARTGSRPPVTLDGELQELSELSEDGEAVLTVSSTGGDLEAEAAAGLLAGPLTPPRAALLALGAGGMALGYWATSRRARRLKRRVALRISKHDLGEQMRAGGAVSIGKGVAGQAWRVGMWKMDKATGGERLECVNQDVVVEVFHPQDGDTAQAACLMRRETNMHIKLAEECNTSIVPRIYAFVDCDVPDSPAVAPYLPAGPVCAIIMEHINLGSLTSVIDLAWSGQLPSSTLELLAPEHAVKSLLKYVTELRRVNIDQAITLQRKAALPARCPATPRPEMALASLSHALRVCSLRQTGTPPFRSLLRAAGEGDPLGDLLGAGVAALMLEATLLGCSINADLRRLLLALLGRLTLAGRDAYLPRVRGSERIFWLKGWTLLLWTFDDGKTGPGSGRLDHATVAELLSDVHAVCPLINHGIGATHLTPKLALGALPAQPAGDAKGGELVDRLASLQRRLLELSRGPGGAFKDDVLEACAREYSLTYRDCGPVAGGIETPPQQERLLDYKVTILRLEVQCYAFLADYGSRTVDRLAAEKAELQVQRLQQSAADKSAALTGMGAPAEQQGKSPTAGQQQGQAHVVKQLQGQAQAEEQGPLRPFNGRAAAPAGAPGDVALAGAGAQGKRPSRQFKTAAAELANGVAAPTASAVALAAAAVPSQQRFLRSHRMATQRTRAAAAAAAAAGEQEHSGSELPSPAADAGTSFAAGLQQQHVFALNLRDASSGGTDAAKNGLEQLPAALNLGGAELPADKKRSLYSDLHAQVRAVQDGLASSLEGGGEFARQAVRHFYGDADSCTLLEALADVRARSGGKAESRICRGQREGNRGQIAYLLHSDGQHQLAGGQLASYQQSAAAAIAGFGGFAAQAWAAAAGAGRPPVQHATFRLATCEDALPKAQQPISNGWLEFAFQPVAGGGPESAATIHVR